jgi:hypothetical protein
MPVANRRTLVAERTRMTNIDSDDYPLVMTTLWLLNIAIEHGHL